MNPLLEALLGVRNGLGLCWVGNAGWLVRGQGKLVAFDLDLERESRVQPSPISTEDLAPVLDVAFVTHGHTNFSVYRGANLDDCGYLITLSEQRIFEPGDSVLLQDHLEDLGEVNVLFVSPTLHNMHLAGSKTLIETLRPHYVFPQHFGTYRVTEQNSYWTVGYPDELRASLSPETRQRFHKLEQGAVFQIPAQ